MPPINREISQLLRQSPHIPRTFHQKLTPQEPGSCSLPCSWRPTGLWVLRTSDSAGFIHFVPRHLGWFLTHRSHSIDYLWIHGLARRAKKALDWKGPLLTAQCRWQTLSRWLKDTRFALTFLLRSRIFWAKRHKPDEWRDSGLKSTRDIMRRSWIV